MLAKEGIWKRSKELPAAPPECGYIIMQETPSMHLPIETLCMYERMSIKWPNYSVMIKAGWRDKYDGSGCASMLFSGSFPDKAETSWYSCITVCLIGLGIIY